MAASVSNSRLPCSRNFALIKDSMLQSDELPLAEVLDSNHWQEIFDAHEIDFGNDEDAIYTPAITLWALISQVFFKGEMRSCKAAVGRVASNTWQNRLQLQHGSLLSRSSQDLMGSRSRYLLPNCSIHRSDLRCARRRS